eukprot:g23897.t1
MTSVASPNAQSDPPTLLKAMSMSANPQSEEVPEASQRLSLDDPRMIVAMQVLGIDMEESGPPGLLCLELRMSHDRSPRKVVSVVPAARRQELWERKKHQLRREVEEAKVTLIDTTAVPRITIAQKMDVLSSQAKCAGHRAVLEGAYAFERFYQGEITAAGKYPPCHTMVLGIGVAGLAAMGTSSALGSVVRAWDVRDVSDQVKSMGGKWITVDFKDCERLNQRSMNKWVTIIGYTDLAGRMGMQASAMYATNMMHMVNHVTGKEGAEAFMPNVNKALGSDEGDIVVKSMVCCKAIEPKAEKAAAVIDPAQEARQTSAAVAGTSALAIGASLGGDPGFIALLNTFGLAGAAGYQAVWGVTHALHTPLMAVTNAISGLTAAGGLMLMGTGGGAMAQGLAQASVAISAVNIAGGFLVTKRMLDLFRKPGQEDFTSIYLLPAAGLAVVPFVLPAGAPTVGTLSGLMCIGAIGGLSSQKTAQFGLALGVTGVTGAMSMTLAALPAGQLAPALGLVAAGGAAGFGLGKAVNPMALPQTVAGFHALVGAAAVATCLGSHMIHPDASVGHKVGAMLGNAIGGITFTGSLVAFGKLNGNMIRNLLNLGMAASQMGMLGLYCATSSPGLGTALMYGTTALSSTMGVHLVGSVGGGDMPCCITVLNSYSGWALVAEGMLLGSPTLTVVGSLIGFSGAILTKIMCDAMNRDIMNVIFGGMSVAPPKKGGAVEEEHRETKPEQVADLLLDSKEVMIVPGYGMAVSQAGRAVADIANFLKEKGINTRFSIHPVAGRMPGQMNVLLAEAGVPYDWVYEMDEVQETRHECSIYGMPVIKVWEAKNCIYLKRSMAGGYADLENPVFFRETTQMLLGDGKSSCEGIAAALKAKS